MRGSGRVEGTTDAGRPGLQDMRLDHGGADDLLAEQLLESPVVIVGIEQVVGDLIEKPRLVRDRRTSRCRGPGPTQCLSCYHGTARPACPLNFGVRLYSRYLFTERVIRWQSQFHLSKRLS